jgi:hypothetical protein
MRGEETEIKVIKRERKRGDRDKAQAEEKGRGDRERQSNITQDETIGRKSDREIGLRMRTKVSENQGHMFPYRRDIEGWLRGEIWMDCCVEKSGWKAVRRYLNGWL